MLANLNNEPIEVDLGEALAPWVRSVMDVKSSQGAADTKIVWRTVGHRARDTMALDAYAGVRLTRRA